MPLEFMTQGPDEWLLDLSPSDFDERSRTLLLGPSWFESYARVLSVPDPPFDGASETDIASAAFEAVESEVLLVERTISTLQAASRSGTNLRFLLWTGWPYRPGLPPAHRVALTDIRECVLARGTAEDWANWTAEVGTERGFPPSLVWPASREWCVAFDVDSHFAGVGATSYVIESLLSAEPRAVRCSREDIPPMYR